MPSLPIPVFVALVLGVACLRHVLERKRSSRLGLLLGLCAIQSLMVALAQHFAVPGARWMQPVTAALIPPAVWLALQTTAVRSFRRSDLLHGLVPLLALALRVVASPGLDVLLPGAFLGYGLAIVAQSLRGADTQPRALLAHGDIPAWIWGAIGGALSASALSDGVILCARLLGHAELQPWIITVFSVGTLILIGVFSLSPHLGGAVDDQTGAAAATAEPDEALWARVREHMDREKPYLDPDLTLTRLARQLRVPTKTLSTTINRATGENVSRFVNKARIEHAQAELRRGASVTEAMLSSGFYTKSNFNREFLRVSGANPSAWLKATGRP